MDQVHRYHLLMFLYKLDASQTARQNYIYTQFRMKMPKSGTSIKFQFNEKGFVVGWSQSISGR